MLVLPPEKYGVQDKCEQHFETFRHKEASSETNIQNPQVSTPGHGALNDVFEFRNFRTQPTKSVLYLCGVWLIGFRKSAGRTISAMAKHKCTRYMCLLHVVLLFTLRNVHYLLWMRRHQCRVVLFFAPPLDHAKTIFFVFSRGVYFSGGKRLPTPDMGMSWCLQQDYYFPCKT